MRRIQSWLFAVLIFVLPSNLFLKFAEESGYVSGLLVDYLLPKLYLSDLVIFGLFICWGIELFQKRRTLSFRSRRVKIFIGLNIFVLVLLAAVQLRSPQPLSSLWFLLKLVEFELLAVWLLQHFSVVKEKTTLFALSVMILFQSLVGLGQFIKQGPVFPSYLWLGETRLDKRAGLARDTFQFQEKVLPYGTTSHPNVLGGVLAVAMMALLLSTFKDHAQKSTWKWGAVALALLSAVTLWLTQSWSAWLSVGGAALAFVIWKQLGGSKTVSRILLLFIAAVFLVSPFLTEQLAENYTANPSFNRRSALNQSAVRMFAAQPLFGVGLNVFTMKLEEYVSTTEVVRFVQPAHHIGLLMLAEEGVFGVVLELCVMGAVLLLLKQKQRQRFLQILPFVLLPFLPLVIWDHYLWTQQSGQLLAVIGIFLFSKVFTEAE